LAQVKFGQTGMDKPPGFDEACNLIV